MKHWRGTSCLARSCQDQTKATFICTSRTWFSGMSLLRRKMKSTTQVCPVSLFSSLAATSTYSARRFPTRAVWSLPWANQRTRGTGCNSSKTKSTVWWLKDCTFTSRLDVFTLTRERERREREEKIKRVCVYDVHSVHKFRCFVAKKSLVEIKSNDTRNQ